MFMRSSPFTKVRTQQSQVRKISLMLLVWMTVQLLLVPTGTRAQTPPPALPKPENIACTGYEADTVVVSWVDKATDETNYRVELKIGNGPFQEVATLSPNKNGAYDAYRDKGINTANQDRHYRVRAYRASDNISSPWSDGCSNRRILETSNFRFFYGLTNTGDLCQPIVDDNRNPKASCLSNPNFLQRAADALQGSADAFARVGFTKPVGTHLEGLDKIPVNIMWCDGGGQANSSGLCLSPELLEKPFDLTTRVGDPIAWIVSLHELFHYQQFHY